MLGLGAEQMVAATRGHRRRHGRSNSSHWQDGRQCAALDVSANVAKAGVGSITSRPRTATTENIRPAEVTASGTWFVVNTSAVLEAASDQRPLASQVAKSRGEFPAAADGNPAGNSPPHSRAESKRNHTNHAHYAVTSPDMHSGQEHDEQASKKLSSESRKCVEGAHSVPRQKSTSNVPGGTGDRLRTKRSGCVAASSIGLSKEPFATTNGRTSRTSRTTKSRQVSKTRHDSKEVAPGPSKNDNKSKRPSRGGEPISSFKGCERVIPSTTGENVKLPRPSIVIDSRRLISHQPTESVDLKGQKTSQSRGTSKTALPRGATFPRSSKGIASQRTPKEDQLLVSPKGFRSPQGPTIPRPPPVPVSTHSACAAKNGEPDEALEEIDAAPANTKNGESAKEKVLSEKMTEVKVPGEEKKNFVGAVTNRLTSLISVGMRVFKNKEQSQDSAEPKKLPKPPARLVSQSARRNIPSKRPRSRPDSTDAYGPRRDRLPVRGEPCPPCNHLSRQPCLERSRVFEKEPRRDREKKPPIDVEKELVQAVAKEYSQVPIKQGAEEKDREVAFEHGLEDKERGGDLHKNSSRVSIKEKVETPTQQLQERKTYTSKKSSVKNQELEAEQTPAEREESHKPCSRPSSRPSSKPSQPAKRNIPSRRPCGRPDSTDAHGPRRDRSRVTGQPSSPPEHFSRQPCQKRLRMVDKVDKEPRRDCEKKPPIDVEKDPVQEVSKEHDQVFSKEHAEEKDQEVALEYSLDDKERTVGLPSHVSIKESVETPTQQLQERKSYPSRKSSAKNQKLHAEKGAASAACLGSPEEGCIALEDIETPPQVEEQILSHEVPPRKSTAKVSVILRDARRSTRGSEAYTRVADRRQPTASIVSPMSKGGILGGLAHEDVEGANVDRENVSTEDNEVETIEPRVESFRKCVQARESTTKQMDRRSTAQRTSGSFTNARDCPSRDHARQSTRDSARGTIREKSRLTLKDGTNGIDKRQDDGPVTCRVTVVERTRNIDSEGIQDIYDSSPEGARHSHRGSVNDGPRVNIRIIGRESVNDRSRTSARESSRGRVQRSERNSVPDNQRNTVQDRVRSSIRKKSGITLHDTSRDVDGADSPTRRSRTTIVKSINGNCPQDRKPDSANVSELDGLRGSAPRSVRDGVRENSRHSFNQSAWDHARGSAVATGRDMSVETSRDRGRAWECAPECILKGTGVNMASPVSNMSTYGSTRKMSMKCARVSSTRVTCNTVTVAPCFQDANGRTSGISCTSDRRGSGTASTKVVASRSVFVTVDSEKRGREDKLALANGMPLIEAEDAAYGREVVVEKQPLSPHRGESREGKSPRRRRHGRNSSATQRQSRRQSGRRSGRRSGRHSRRQSRSHQSFSNVAGDVSPARSPSQPCRCTARKNSRKSANEFIDDDVDISGSDASPKVRCEMIGVMCQSLDNASFGRMPNSSTTRTMSADGSREIANMASAVSPERDKARRSSGANRSDGGPTEFDSVRPSAGRNQATECRDQQGSVGRASAEQSTTVTRATHPHGRSTRPLESKGLGNGSDDDELAARSSNSSHHSPSRKCTTPPFDPGKELDMSQSSNAEDSWISLSTKEERPKGDRQVSINGSWSSHSEKDNWLPGAGYRPAGTTHSETTELSSHVSGADNGGDCDRSQHRRTMQTRNLHSNNKDSMSGCFGTVHSPQVGYKMPGRLGGDAFTPRRTQSKAKCGLASWLSCLEEVLDAAQEWEDARHRFASSEPPELRNHKIYDPSWLNGVAENNPTFLNLMHQWMAFKRAEQTGTWGPTSEDNVYPDSPSMLRFVYYLRALRAGHVSSTFKATSACRTECARMECQCRCIGKRTASPCVSSTHCGGFHSTPGQRLVPVTDRLRGAGSMVDSTCSYLWSSNAASLYPSSVQVDRPRARDGPARSPSCTGTLAKDMMGPHLREDYLKSSSAPERVRGGARFDFSSPTSEEEECNLMYPLRGGGANGVPKGSILNGGDRGCRVTPCKDTCKKPREPCPALRFTREKSNSKRDWNLPPGVINAKRAHEAGLLGPSGQGGGMDLGMSSPYGHGGVYGEVFRKLAMSRTKCSECGVPCDYVSPCDRADMEEVLEEARLKKQSLLGAQKASYQATPNRGPSMPNRGQSSSDPDHGMPDSSGSAEQLEEMDSDGNTCDPAPSTVAVFNFNECDTLFEQHMHSGGGECCSCDAGYC